MTPISDRKQQLQSRLADLSTRLDGIQAELIGHESRDWSDLATERESDQMLETMGLGSQAEVRAITAALQRIEDGTYGLCVRCGEPIEPARLDLLPFTPFCKEHAA
ncbi:MAG: TraR/DksA C4-type zinc finger protein [Pseudorhodobacter sp.]|nr:TraR/DksA C4-type zinc finger protein [Pseudorhodobacter sp.]